MFLYRTLFRPGAEGHVHCMYSEQTYVYLFVYIYYLYKIFHYFLTKHQEYLVSPLSVLGSTIENMFGQLKFSAREELEAVNY